MAVPATAAPDRQPSPGLSLNLSSNNPFRNRSSAASPSPSSADAKQQNLPFSSSMSKNPFLDPVDGGVGNKTATNGNNVAMTDDIFKDLSLLDQPATNGGPPPRGPPTRSGTLQPNPRQLGPDERRRPPRGPPRGPVSPQKRPEHRRRASESSIMEKDRQPRGERDRSNRPPRTESEERRRRERRKEREERYKREGHTKSNRRTREKRNLDLIDKLDVTGIYGQGLFHHDGPFDACNPHRNARKDRRAPMQAFPEGSANMALGGAGPLHSRLDLDKFHGRGEEGFQDYGATRKQNPAYVAPQYINPHDRIQPVHGEESYGLGTSTFLEGAPASKRALEQRETEDQTMMQEAPVGGGLQRKKSLAQRLRGMSGSQRRQGPGEIRSPEARYNGVDSADNSPPRVKAISAGGPARAIYTRENETNPFDNEYDAAFEKKGTQIRIAEQEKPNVGRARAPSSPKPAGLTRSVTADSAIRTSGEEEKPSGGGFLNRMKSLKGGKRVRPERKDSNSAAAT